MRNGDRGGEGRGAEERNGARAREARMNAPVRALSQNYRQARRPLQARRRGRGALGTIRVFLARHSRDKVLAM